MPRVMLAAIWAGIGLVAVVTITLILLVHVLALENTGHQQDQQIKAILNAHSTELKKSNITNALIIRNFKLAVAHHGETFPYLVAICASTPGCPAQLKVASAPSTRHLKRSRGRAAS